MADDLASMLMGVAPPQGGLSEMMRRNWEMRQPGPVWENNHAAPKKATERPADWAVKSGVAEAISPTMGAYGVGAGVGSTYAAAKAGDYGAAAESALPLAAMGIMPGPKGAKPPRAVDGLGYYSGALEAARNLPQAKGTVEQMAAMLQKGGAKAGEIEATGLGKFLEGRPSVTRDEIVSHLEGNRLGLNERVRDRSPPREDELARLRRNNGSPDDILMAELGLADDPAFLKSFDRTKWSAHSLDPSNPTYRETVLHLPASVPTFEQYAAEVRRTGREPTQANYDQRVQQNNWPPALMQDFQSGHFSEPNIVGHMMTSMTKHEGKPVYTIDQIQSDWGQKLRDGGVRDEAKIAELKAKLDAAKAAEERLKPAFADRGQELEALAGLENYGGNLERMKAEKYSNGKPVHPLSALLTDEYVKAMQDRKLLWAELNTAEASTPGHPLVNTTDQWTNTTLRRAIQQAIEAKAAGIAVPTGDTVLSYNPGDTAGMRGFYGSPEQRGIVPKNLANILQKMDPSIQAQFIQQLETPTKGMAGNGFTYFPLTDAAIAKAREGLPLFSMAAAGAGMTLPEFLQGQQPNQ